MLDLNAKLEIHGVTLYRDFDDKDLFYYMPGLPHIAEESGNPRFSLMVFEKGGEAGEEEAGGFLTLVVSTDLGDLKDKVLRQLKSRFGDQVRLSSVDFTKGTVRLLGLDLGEASNGEGGTPSDAGPAGLRFIEKVEATETPMLSADNRAFFSARLSEEGAALMLGVLEDSPDAMPFGVAYDLSFTGLLTVQDLKIEINFERSYDYLRQKFGINAVVVQAEIDNVVEELKTNESIKIIDTVRTLELSTPEAMSSRQEAIDKLVKELATGALFRPTLQVGKPSINETATFGSAPASALNDPISAAIRSGGPGAGILAGMAAAHMPQGAPASASPTTSAAAASGGSSSSSTPGSSTPSGSSSSSAGSGGSSSTAPSNSRAAEVYRNMGSPRATFVMRNLSQSERRTVTYDLSRTAAQERKYPLVNDLSFMASQSVLRNKIARINLNHPFFKRIDVDIEAAAMDFEAEGVTKLTVDMRYGTRPDGTYKEEISVILEDPSVKKSFTFFADESGTKTYEYRITAHFKPDFGIGDESLEVTGPWIESDSRLISAHSQKVARRLNMNLRLPRVIPQDLLEVRAVVHYDNADGTVEDSEEVILKPDQTQKNVVVRYSDDSDLVEVSAKAIFSDGNEIDLPAEKRPDPENGVADDVVEFFLKRRPSLDFDIIMQDPLDELANVIVDYEVHQGDETLVSKSLQIEQPLTRQLISEPLGTDEPPATLKLRERRLYSSGGLEELDWHEATDTSVVVGIPAADVRTVAIRYVGPPMDAAGMQGILVELKYEDPGGDPEFSQSDTVFINNLDVTDWKFRKADRKANTFQYRVTIFLDNGEERSSEFRDYAGDDLILRSVL